MVGRLIHGIDLYMGKYGNIIIKLTELYKNSSEKSIWS